MTGKLLGVTPPTRENARTRLLVSVRDAEEAHETLAGGADIVDGKDPSTGALGALPFDTLLGIRRAIPRDISFSAALGDAPERTELERVRDGFGADSLAFGKLGLADCNQSRADRVVANAVELLGHERVVLVAYADFDLVGALRPEKVRALAIRFSVAGVLLDTARKESGGLMQLWSYERLGAFVADTRDARLMVALAGGMTLLDVAAAVSTRAEIIGVRGAACVGGRNGRVDRLRVRSLREAIDQADAVARNQSSRDPRPSGPTTRHGRPSGSTRRK